ncbi:MAG: hypothetical protein Q7S22_06770 [Candidatus Micrarchaeota archaeon]|nr:hypothetical protein [Candidatus Micrarchaeota archaeon]
MTVKQRPLEVKRAVAIRFWSKAERLHEEITRNHSYDKCVQLSHRALRWFIYLEKMTFSKNVEDRLFAAEQLPKFLEQTGRLHLHNMHKGREVEVLASDPEILVQTTFLKGLCTPNNAANHLDLLNKIVCCTEEPEILETLGTELAKTIKNSSVDETLRTAMTKVLINVFFTANNAKFDSVIKIIETELYGLNREILIRPITMFLTELSNRLKAAGEEAMIRDSMILTMIVIVDLAAEKHIIETAAELTELYNYSSVPEQLKRTIQKALMKFGSYALTPDAETLKIQN